MSAAREYQRKYRKIADLSDRKERKSEGGGGRRSLLEILRLPDTSLLSRAISELFAPSTSIARPVAFRGVAGCQRDTANINRASKDRGDGGSFVAGRREKRYSCSRFHCRYLVLLLDRRVSQVFLGISRDTGVSTITSRKREYREKCQNHRFIGLDLERTIKRGEELTPLLEILRYLRDVSAEVSAQASLRHDIFEIPVLSKNVTLLTGKKCRELIYERSSVLIKSNWT